MRTTGNTPNRVTLRKKWSAHEFIVSFIPLTNYVNGAWIVQFRELAEKIITESACPMRVTRKNAFSCKEKHILSFAFKDSVPMKKVSLIV